MGKATEPGRDWERSEKRQYARKPGPAPTYPGGLYRINVYMGKEDWEFATAYAKMVGSSASRLLVGLLRAFRRQAARQAKKQAAS